MAMPTIVQAIALEVMKGRGFGEKVSFEKF